MVHNGIEYGLMAAYAEGLNILKKADSGLPPQEADAETTPLREPAGYQYQLDIADIAEVWRRGSVVASWLLDLTAAARVDEGVPAPVIATALFSRFESRGDADYADQLLSAMRKQFGGQDEKPGRKAR
jgi:6-phosphogluconate dehydrogenase